MRSWENYQLLDFGEGRKLERLGEFCLDRPAPAAVEVVRRQPEIWSAADARYERFSENRGQWSSGSKLPETWPMPCGAFCLQLKATPFGHVGVFPEQYANWRWIAKRIRQHQGATFRLLNLFAYTGGSTLAAAAAGAEVVHVDGAKNVVQWARRNAELSGLHNAPIRWLTEDVRRLVSREIRRKSRYQAIVLDPPSFGHGPQGAIWKVATDLMPLLKDCRKLLADDSSCVVLTCHSPGFGPAELGACLQDAIVGRCSQQVVSQVMNLSVDDGRRLSAGVVARWPS